MGLKGLGKSNFYVILDSPVHTSFVPCNKLLDQELQGDRVSPWTPGWRLVYFLWVVRIRNTQEVCVWYMLVAGNLHSQCDRGLFPDQWWWVILQQGMKQEEKSTDNFAPVAPWTQRALEASTAPLLCNMKVHQG